MSSMGGHFVFFLPAPKQLHAALLSWRTTPALIAGNHVAEKTWKLMPSWKTTPAAFRNWFCNAKEVPACESYWCICRRCWARFSSFSVYSKPTGSFVTYFPKKRKNFHICFTATEGPRGTYSGWKKCGVLRFSEVSNEARCCHGVYRKRRKTGPASTTNASIWSTNSNFLGG